MKWTYFIKHKMAAALLLGTVMGIVLLNNFTEQKNSEELNEAFSSMYEDRLVAESYILSMYRNLHEIEALSDGKNITIANSAATHTALNSLQETVSLYAKTKLTPLEENEFVALQKKIGDVAAGVASGNSANAHLAANEALQKLAVLSEIQVQEGARLTDDSRRIYQSSLSSSQFEMAMLIVIGVLLQALIFSSRTLQTTTKKFGMN